jgi:hypothetical protein
MSRNTLAFASTPRFGLLWGLACAQLLACDGDDSTGTKPTTRDAGNEHDAAQPMAADAGAAPAGNYGRSLNGSGMLGAELVMKGVAAAAEDHVCVVVDLENDAPVWVSAVHATLTTGSHHLIVDRQAADSPIATTPDSCAPTMASDQTRLMIAQQHDTRIDLPDHVAYKLDAHQHLFLQLHYINLSDHAEDVRGAIELVIAPASDTDPSEVHSIFTGSTSFELPPQQKTSVRFFLNPAPSDAAPRHFFALTSHTHSLGVRATIERVPSMDAPATTPVHESLDWSEPPLSLYTPPMVFGADEGLRLTCDFMNTTDHVVRFGTSFNDEMCFMWMYYYEQ